MHCSTNGDVGCTCSVDCPSFGLDDFTQSSWYTSLYGSTNAAIIETNDPPLDEQLPSLLANQLDAITELEKVNQKIQSLQSLLSDAFSYHNCLRKVVSDYRAALSPIRRIPFDIIHRILKNTERTDCYRARPGTPALDLEMDIYNGPWRFSKVCRLWRAVAIQSPEFWCDIRIDFKTNENHEYRSSGLCALLYEGIRRSALRGLQVRLHQDYMSDDEDDDSEQDEDEDSGRGKEDVIRALFAHSSQIRALTIKMLHSSELDDIISSSSSNFTSLQRLYIELEDCNPIEGSNILEAFGGSPSLVKVELNGLPVERCQDLNFPWNQLQIFEHMRSLSPADVVDIVHLCPRLQKYTGSRSNPRALDSTVTPTAIHHTTITHLDLSMDSSSLLRHITIPSLTVLRVSAVDNIQLTHLIQFISRSQCSIQELKLYLAGTSLLKYNECLELLPSLTRLALQLDDKPLLDEYQSVLTPERLPRLQALEIEVYGTTGDPLAFCTPQLISTLIHIIQSRSSMLQSFTFCSRLAPLVSWFSPTLLRQFIDVLRGLLLPYNQKLRAWIEGGMVLHLFYGTFPRLCQQTNGWSWSQMHLWF
jgi:hypothetical protein